MLDQLKHLLLLIEQEFKLLDACNAGQGEIR
jgi:hypothetical protein